MHKHSYEQRTAFYAYCFLRWTFPVHHEREYVHVDSYGPLHLSGSGFACEWGHGPAHHCTLASMSAAETKKTQANGSAEDGKLTPQVYCWALY